MSRIGQIVEPVRTQICSHCFWKVLSRSVDHGASDALYLPRCRYVLTSGVNNSRGGIPRVFLGGNVLLCSADGAERRLFHLTGGSVEINVGLSYVTITGISPRDLGSAGLGFE